MSLPLYIARLSFDFVYNYNTIYRKDYCTKLENLRKNVLSRTRATFSLTRIKYLKFVTVVSSL